MVNYGFESLGYLTNSWDIEKYPERQREVITELRKLGFSAYMRFKGEDYNTPYLVVEW